MAKSFVVTNRKKLDAFLRAGNSIEDLEIRVGQLTGKPKYPKGHVGSKSRDRRGITPRRRIDPEELRRRQAIRAGRRQLEGLDKESRKATLRSLRNLFKSAGLSSRTLSRRTGARTPVARVAGVMHAGSAYHVNAIVDRRTALRAELQAILRDMKQGRPVAKQLQAIGRNSKDAVRSGVRKAGHFDTGRLYRNTQFEIRSMRGYAKFKADAKRERELKRQAKRQRRRR
jgi:hypothetical protein